MTLSNLDNVIMVNSDFHKIDQGDVSGILYVFGVRVSLIIVSTFGIQCQL